MIQVGPDGAMYSLEKQFIKCKLQLTTKGIA